MRTNRRTMVGTYHWMAPEVIRCESYNVLADIWSFGIVIIEIVLGEPPFSDMTPENVTSAVLKTDMVQYAQKETNMEPLLIELLKNCVNHNPEKRKSAFELQSLGFFKKYPISEIATRELAKSVSSILQRRMQKSIKLSKLGSTGSKGSKIK